MQLIKNAPLSSFVTFGVEATCDHLYAIHDLDELRVAAQHLETPLVLGGGSNVLPIGDIKRNVLKIELKGIELEERLGQEPLLHVAAGENWHALVMHTLENGLGGLENLSLIPGTAGAAPIQNIGAYGVELDQVFESLEAVRIGDGEVVVFKKNDCGFGYRDSIFKREAKEKYIITSISLRLNRHHTVNTSYGAIKDVLKEKNIEHPTIKDVSDAVIAIRQSKLPDPAVIGNAGSFFKNPVIPRQHFETLKALYSTLPGYPASAEEVKIPAGWLIEQCGWKGKSIGQVGCYQHQALVIVNHGGATGEEVWNFAQQIIASVQEKFNITLLPEVNIWKS